MQVGLIGSSRDSLPEFMNFELFGKAILVVNIEFELFWAIHSASEEIDTCFSRVELSSSTLAPNKHGNSHGVHMFLDSFASGCFSFLPRGSYELSA